MDTMSVLVMLALPFILGVLVRAVAHAFEETKIAPNTLYMLKIKCTLARIRRLKKMSPPKEEKPKQGKFPAWVDELSERELFDLLYASFGGLEEAIRIVSSGETFWLGGYRTDDEFIYSDNGRDLFPVTIHKN